MKESFFENRGIVYRTNEFVADRPTLVFIHGLSGSASAWFPYEGLLSAMHNLLTFDLRGHGISAKPTYYEDYALVESAEDLYELLEYLQVGRFILISHSFGTLVALEFLLAHEGRVSGAIFLSSVAGHRRTKLFSLTCAATVILTSVFNVLPFHPVIRGRRLCPVQKHRGLEPTENKARSPHYYTARVCLVDTKWTLRDAPRQSCLQGMVRRALGAYI